MKAVTRQSATELLALLRTQKISAFELAEEYIRQIARLNPQINALVDFDPDRVRQQARAAENSSAKLGSLTGLPVTVKSSISTAGHRCEIGSLVNRGHVPAQDATVVARLRQAGAIILGTTNCPEYLMAYVTENDLHGRTNNPWNLDYTPGGSSGGESAAIAAGMSAGGLGSDSGGSVRVPAHFTGICSLKPTPGRIPGAGHLPPCIGPFSFLGAIGPMARTIEDVALLFRALAGQDPVDPASPPVGPREPTLEEVKHLPVGYFEDDGLTPVTPETRQAVQDAAQALRSEGFDVRPFRPQGLEKARKLWELFFVRCGAMFEEPLVRGHEDQMSPVFRDFLARADAAPPLTADELLMAWAEADTTRGELLAQMQGFPLLLCPVCSVPAFRHDERSWTIDGTRVEYLDAMRYSQWFNLLAAPAAVMPVGRSADGLPIGVQVAGRPYEDELVLKVASVIDHAFGYVAPPNLLIGNSDPTHRRQEISKL
jgi:Asp-tRNA(Asn)/Glu-tRNA(Gln) amidotransferase A subunit family amidase